MSRKFDRVTSDGRPNLEMPYEIELNNNWSEPVVQEALKWCRDTLGDQSKDPDALLLYRYGLRIQTTVFSFKLKEDAVRFKLSLGAEAQVVHTYSIPVTYCS